MVRVMQDMTGVVAHGLVGFLLLFPRLHCTLLRGLVAVLSCSFLFAFPIKTEGSINEPNHKSLFAALKQCHCHPHLGMIGPFLVITGLSFAAPFRLQIQGK